MSIDRLSIMNQSEEMDMEPEDLRLKREAFERMQKLIQNEGEDDELDAQEQRRRTRHSRFFHSQHPQSPSSKPNTSKNVVETPRRDAQPKHENIIKATQSTVRERKRAAPAHEVVVVDDEVIGETPTTSHTTKSIKQNALARVSGKRRLLDETPRPLPSSLLMAGKKTKKEPSFKMRPETEQVFKGLSFYFVPDNAIAPARRLRINKAREFGAIWTRNITEATHVVVDKGITYNDLQSMLSALGDESVKVVNEDYPIDCVQFRALLETDQLKYRLAGQPSRRTEAAEAEQASPQSSQVSVVSLQLKPPQRDATKWDHVPPRGTPDRSGGQSTPATVDSQPIELDKGGPAIDTTTEEAEKAEAADSTSMKETTDSGGKDELSAFISMMQEFKDLPLDKDDEEDGHTEAGSIAAENSEENERDESPQKKRVATSYKRAAKPVFNVEEGFACHRAGEKNAQLANPNSRTVEILQKMLDYYLRVNDPWRSMAYRKAISVLKRQQTRISTEEEALQLPGIGGRLAQKIEEIVSTNSLKRLEYAEMDERDAVLQLFLGIYGVGSKLANQWISQGHKTLDDLIAKVKLTPSQQVGIERYDDLNTRIPRREIELLGGVVKKTAKDINPHVEMIIGGSYRRGAASSGDIDFIVTQQGTTAASELHSFLQKLVSRLEKDGFLVQRLASMRTAGGDGSLWHGCCVLPKMPGLNVNEQGEYKPIWRRIDFLLVPYSQMGGALIYFTGDDVFNRSLRLLARKKGMRLNQRGLYRRGLDDPGTVEDDLIEGSDEKKIFDILGVKWRPPEERWC